MLSFGFQTTIIIVGQRFPANQQVSEMQTDCKYTKSVDAEESHRYINLTWKDTKRWSFRVQWDSNPRSLFSFYQRMQCSSSGMSSNRLFLITGSKRIILGVGRQCQDLQKKVKSLRMISSFHEKADNWLDILNILNSMFFKSIFLRSEKLVLEAQVVPSFQQRLKPNRKR